MMSSYLYNGNNYIVKTASLYLDGSQYGKWKIIKYKHPAKKQSEFFFDTNSWSLIFCSLF